MESFITLLALVLLVIAAAVIAGIVIHNRKRRQPRRPEGAEKYIVPQEPQPPVVEEAERTLAGETPLTPLAETQPTGIDEAHLPAMAEMQPTAVEEAQSRKGQEAQPIAEETSWATVQEAQETVPAETQPTIIVKEIQTSRAGETQAIAVEQAQAIQAQAIAAEETEPTVTERTQPQGAEKVQPEGAEEAGAEVKRGAREPIKKGGKPRGSTQDPEKERTQGIQPRRSKPEIVCWERERQWIAAVEVPEELLTKPGLTILQNGFPLSQDESKETCWRLEQVFGEVIVRWNEDEAVQEAKIVLGQDGYLLFKLGGQDLNRGRFVRSPSSGSYLVMAPDNWERDETFSGPPPMKPEPVSLAGYNAHFFLDLDKGSNDKIAFLLPEGRQLVIKLKSPRFELVGRQLEDASEHIGPLFSERPPRIRAFDAQAWKDVGTIVVGEEGSGRGKWRTAFNPDPSQIEQDLPSEVADRKGGWYFLRFYDQDGGLIESMDFRFLTVLREIGLPPLPHLPTGDGHKPACIELVHEADCAVQPVSNLAKIQVERQNDKTLLRVPPDPTCDESRWSIGPKGGPGVEVTINVERIWWAIGEENKPPAKWQDRPVELSSEDFKATSNKALWLRLPRRRWVDQVLVGFQRSKARPYDVRVTEHTVAIPFREFGDSSEIRDQTQEYPLRLWITRNQQEIEGVLAVLQRSQLPVAPPHSPSLRSWSGLGRKKTAMAKAVMRNGAGEIQVNGRRLDDYFKPAPRRAKQFLERLLGLEEVRGLLSQMEVNITVQGSNPTTMQQAKAVTHAIARALMDYDPRLMPLLRQAGFGGVRVKASKANRRGKQ